MKPFCPSSGAFLCGTLAFSQARTWSRKVFSDSLRSKSMRLILNGRALRDRRNHVRGKELQGVRVVEQEVLQHEQVDAELRLLVDLLGDLFRRSDEPALGRHLQHL